MTEFTSLLNSRWKRDPCALYYTARLLAKLGDTGLALSTLERSVEGGYYPFRFLARDPWLDPLRGHPNFKRFSSAEGVTAAVAAFAQAGGARVLSVGRPEPIPS
jgi:hypothetical protein